MIERFKQRLYRIGARLGFRRDWYLIVVAAGVGTVTAVCAILFIEALHFAQRHVDGLIERVPTDPVPWLLPIFPVIGALLTGLTLHFFASEARGHGVPEIMDAVYRKKAKIRPGMAMTKAATSIFTIGSGGSAGAEGPIVQLGSALGSGIAQVLQITREQAATLLGCGAAAAISSVFNAPIAGVFFVLEILLRDFSLRTFTPIVVASVFSAATTQAYYGQNDAIFAVSGSLTDYQFRFAELPSYIALGLVCGGVAYLFVRLLYRVEDFYNGLKKVHPVVKPMTGALVVGLMGMAFIALSPSLRGHTDQPAFFGNGYETITSLLQHETYVEAAPAPGDHSPHLSVVSDPFGDTVSVTMLALGALLACKIIATSLTISSGGSGGVFAPSLFVGATLGALFGVVLERIGLLPEGGSPAAYALVGMAAVVAGTTHAPLTAILILFELTRDVYVLLPIMLAAVVSTLSAQYFLRDSVYTLKLRRRGVLVGSAADLTLLRRLTARDINYVPHVQVHAEDPVSKLLDLRDSYKIVDFVVVDDHDDYVGLVTGQDIRTALIEREAIPYLLVEDLLRRGLPTIHPDDTLDVVLEKFSRHDVSSLGVLDGSRESSRRIAGLITRQRLMRRYQQALSES